MWGSSFSWSVQGGVGYFSNERRFSINSSFQGISSNWFLWKRNNASVVIQTWCWRGEKAASTGGSNRPALAFYFSMRNCYMFFASTCRRELDLGWHQQQQLRYVHKECRCGEATSDYKTCLATKFVGFCQCAGVFCLQVPTLCTDLDATLLYILILGTHGKFARQNIMLALGVCLLQPYSSAGCRFAASKDHVYITTDKSCRFHNNEYDAMPCELDSTENPRSLEKCPTPPWDSW